MAKSSDVQLVVITPEAQLLSEATDSVVIPAHDGELGVLNGRASLMCELGVGRLRYQKGGKEQRVFVDGGFAQVHDNHVTVLTANAIPAEKVSAESVSLAEQAVQKATGTTPEALEARSRAQLRLSVLRGMRGS